MSALAALFFAAAVSTPPVHPAARLGGLARSSRSHPAAVPATVVAVLAASLAVIVSDRLALVVALAIAAFTLLRAVGAHREKLQARRRQTIVAAFLGHVVTNLEAGSTVAESCRRAELQLPESCPASLAGEIRHLVSAASTGAAPLGLLDQADSGGAAGELAEVAALWTLTVARGLPLVSLLAQARDRIDTAVRHRAATEAALAGPKTTAVVLSLLPLAGVAMGSAMGANPLGLLLGPGVGGWLLVAGTFLVCAGFLACQHIIRKAVS